MKQTDRELLCQKLHNKGGCDAPENSWADGWDKAIEESINIVLSIPVEDEAEQRKQGCEFCNGHTSYTFSEVSFFVMEGVPYWQVKGNKTALEVDFFIKYCPVCGRKLVEDEI